MAVSRLLTICEQIARVLEDSAAAFDEIGLSADAAPLRKGVKELEDAMMSVLADSSEYVTPESARWLVQELRHARGLVQRLLDPAEITGDEDLVAEAQHWISHIDKGPPTHE
jgi:hypothetical protein